MKRNHLQMLRTIRAIENAPLSNYERMTGMTTGGSKLGSGRAKGAVTRCVTPEMTRKHQAAMAGPVRTLTPEEILAEYS